MKPKDYPPSIVGHELEFVKNVLLKPNGSLKSFSKIPEHILESLEALTPNLKTDLFPERVYWIVHGLKDYPKICPCGKPITKFHKFSTGYRYKTCSNSCSQQYR